VLRGKLAERDQKIKALEEQAIDLNQRRQDAFKRIDELIGRIDSLVISTDTAASEVS
jgi:hypothetical protein